MHQNRMAWPHGHTDGPVPAKDVWIVAFRGGRRTLTARMPRTPTSSR